MFLTEKNPKNPIPLPWPLMYLYPLLLRPGDLFNRQLSHDQPSHLEKNVRACHQPSWWLPPPSTSCSATTRPKRCKILITMQCNTGPVWVVLTPAEKQYWGIPPLTASCPRAAGVSSLMMTATMVMMVMMMMMMMMVEVVVNMKRWLRRILLLSRLAWGSCWGLGPKVCRGAGTIKTAGQYKATHQTSVLIQFKALNWSATCGYPYLGMRDNKCHFS